MSTAGPEQVEARAVPAERHLPAPCAGRELGGGAWSSLRTATPTVRATRVDGGWSLSGSQPWCTGWGLADVVLVGALVPDTDEVVFGLVRPRGTAGLESTGELRLAAMAGTSTHVLRLSDVRLPDEDVVLLTARGGQGMDLDEPAQRLLRAAAFQVVHSQAAHVRTATLDALAAARA